MKKYMVILVVAALVLGISATAFGHGAINNSQSGKIGLRKGGGYEAMLQRKASILNLTVEELKKELKSGKTFTEIAQTKGLTTEQFKAKVLELQKARLQELVKAGKITQEQANQRLEAMKLRQTKDSCTTCSKVTK